MQSFGRLSPNPPPKPSQHAVKAVTQPSSTHVWLQPQAAAVAARRAPDEEVPALGADVAEGDGLGS